MTKDEALKMALEALEVATTPLAKDRQEVLRARAAIREALAQPEQEPVALPEKIYEFVPTPEPVKWHHPECEGQCIACLIEQVVQEAYGNQGLGYLQRHLASPPQRKPLTDEEIETYRYMIDWTASWSYINFARAIEAAHGIKE